MGYHQAGYVLKPNNKKETWDGACFGSCPFNVNYSHVCFQVVSSKLDKQKVIDFYKYLTEHFPVEIVKCPRNKVPDSHKAAENDYYFEVSWKDADFVSNKERLLFHTLLRIPQEQDPVFAAFDGSFSDLLVKQAKFVGGGLNGSEFRFFARAGVHSMIDYGDKTGPFPSSVMDYQIYMELFETGVHRTTNALIEQYKGL